MVLKIYLNVNREFLNREYKVPKSIYQNSEIKPAVIRSLSAFK